jgi:hypothetical protein
MSMRGLRRAMENACLRYAAWRVQVTPKIASGGFVW